MTTCDGCGVKFQSKDAKRFCSLPCYRTSEAGKEVIKSNREVWLAKHPQEQRSCINCGKTMTLPCARASGSFTNVNGKKRWRPPKRFCSGPCKREWFSNRFDRWVANPEKLCLPQCFDEFLSKDELPCLVDGCAWSGKNLTTHMVNFHGVPRNEFKKIAGFNKTTGVVAQPTAKLLAEANANKGNLRINEYSDINKIQQPRGRISLEAREHHAKALTFRDSSNAVAASKEWRERNPGLTSEYGQRGLDVRNRKSAMETQTCLWCFSEFQRPVWQNTVTCSPECRRKRNSERIARYKRERRKQRRQLNAP